MQRKSKSADKYTDKDNRPIKVRAVIRSRVILSTTDSLQARDLLSSRMLINRRHRYSLNILHRDISSRLNSRTIHRSSSRFSRLIPNMLNHLLLPKVRLLAFRFTVNRMKKICLTFHSRQVVYELL
jgi:hypothetical protein